MIYLSVVWQKKIMKNSKTISSRIDNITHSIFQDICNKENKTSSQIIHQLVVDCVKNSRPIQKSISVDRQSTAESIDYTTEKIIDVFKTYRNTILEYMDIELEESIGDIEIIMQNLVDGLEE